jgi:hypothetical protein
MRYSIIVPHCHGARESTTQRQELETILRRVDSFEVLSKFSNCPTIEHAIVAGLRAARGEAVAVIEPGDRYPIAQLPTLLRGLARADMVCGRRRRHGWSKFVERIGRFPRWLFLGLDTRDPDCLFWAARREAFNGLQVLPRLVPYLPSLVARHGYRVDNVYVADRPTAEVRAAGAQIAPSVPHAARASIFAAWWACRRVRATEQDMASQSAARTATPAPKGAAPNKPSEPYRVRSA